MADVSITIRKTVNGADTTIMVSGNIDDAAIAPITEQLSTLLYSAASSAPAA